MGIENGNKIGWDQLPPHDSLHDQGPPVSSTLGQAALRQDEFDPQPLSEYCQKA